MTTAAMGYKALWTPSAEAAQTGAKVQVLHVFPYLVSNQKSSDYVVVSKQPEGRYTFSVRLSELSPV